MIQRDAFSNEQNSQKTLNHQWNFALWNLRNHNRINLARDTQQEKKQDWKQYRDNHYLKNSEVFFWSCKIGIIQKKVKQGGIHRNKNRME